ncbi:MAG: FTR1 family protein [Cyanophyceae cyanobacterium]
MADLSDWAAALPAFVVTLREGFEATLVVGIVLASLAKASRANLNRWVWFGIVGGIVVSIAIGTFLVQGIQALDQSQQLYAPLFKELLEMGLGITAIALLGWMLIWMTRQSQSLSGEVKSAVNAALNSDAAGWGVFAIVAIAVVREGFETAVFLAAQFQEGPVALVGAIAGLLGAAMLGILLFRWSVRINIASFFKVMGVVLIVLIGALTIGALKHGNSAALVANNLGLRACWFLPDSCILGPQLWDFSTMLSDRQFPGLVFKALLGYRDHLYVVQAIAYVSTVTIISTLYLRNFSIKPTQENDNPPNSQSNNSQSKQTEQKV